MATSIPDRTALQTLALRVISDPKFNKQFTENPKAAIAESGLKFDKATADAIAANAKKAASLTSEMDSVSAHFFFYWHVGNR